MKKIYSLMKTLVVCFTLLSTSGLAQNFAIVGNGTTSNSQYSYPAPYGNYYYGAKHQMLVTAAELLASGMGGGVAISKIGFDITSLNSGPPHIGWTVRVFTTTLTDPLVSGYVTTGLVGQSTPATVTGTVGWNMTTITQFTWTGTENLVIETCFNNSSWIQNYSTRWTTNLTNSSIKTRWNNQDNSVACSSPNFLNTTNNTRPNMRFEYVYNTPCSGIPGANFVLTPTAAICPGTSALIGMGNSYTVGGISYQWQSSTVSNVGPWTTIGGATSFYYTTPTLTSNVYYTAIITCSAGNGNTVAVAGQVLVAPTTTSVVPYYESFEGIGSANELPNCSWIATATPSVTQTYVNSQASNRVPRTGSKFASFYGTYINATNYFYSNGIQLEPGVTYSASVWYTTEFYGYTNFSEFAIMLGTSQSSTGLVNIASVSPAVSPLYTSLSNTFTVASSGLYYVAIKATSNGQYGQYLSWDDLSIIVPCALNTPTVTLSVSSQTVCKGESVTLTSAGANAYNWNIGGNTAQIIDTPNNSIIYSVVATNTLSGCSVTLNSQFVTVYESPNIIVYSNKLSICPGESVNLTAIGAASYTWNTNSNAQVISVSPTITTSYSVNGSNANNCVSTGVQTIIVNQSPTVSISSNATVPNQICKGEAVTLSGAGAVTYSWAANTLFIVAAQAIINPNTSTTYTLIGANADGCTNSTTYALTVAECTGINEASAGLSGVQVYPNPTSGIFTVELNNGAVKTVQVTDVTGKVVMTNSSNTEKVNVNISSLANGIYYVKVQSNNAIEVIKIVKN